MTNHRTRLPLLFLPPILKLILLLTLLLYSPSLFNFFASDDWYHLRLSSISTLPEFFNFFSLTPTPQSTAFYRPLSTQVFFFILNSVFGHNAFFYYAFNLSLFGLSLYLLYRFVILLTNNRRLSLLTLFFYAFSVSSFARLYYLSAIQETFVTVLALASLISYLKRTPRHHLLAFIFFLLAIMSKENAVVIPALLLLVDWYQHRLNLRRLLPYALLLLFYLYSRLQHTLTLPGQSYDLDFSPFRALNTLFWYLLWQLGSPELLIDYISSGLRPIPRFFTDYPFFSYLILFSLFALTFLILINFVKKFSSLNRLFPFSLAFLFFGLLPILFLPDHKYAYETGLPLVGFSLLLAQLVPAARTGYSFLLLFFVFNLFMNYLTYTRHYSVHRPRISHRLYSYLLGNHSQCRQEALNFYFIDPPNAGPYEDYSRQLRTVTSNNHLFQVACGNNSITAYFYPDIPPNSAEIITVSSQQFFTKP